MTDAGPAFRVGNDDMWMDYERLKAELAEQRAVSKAVAGLLQKGVYNRNAALEEAAKVCDARAADWHAYRDHWPIRDEARAIAAQIRALKDKPEPKPAAVDDDGDSIDIGGPPIVPPAKRNQP